MIGDTAMNKWLKAFGKAVIVFSVLVLAGCVPDNFANVAVSILAGIFTAITLTIIFLMINRFGKRKK